MAEEGKKRAAAVATIGVVGAAGLAAYILSRKPAPPPPGLPEIVSNDLTGPSTAVVGEAVRFTGVVGFKSPLPSNATLYIDVYVNDEKKSALSVSVSSGASTASYEFTLVFTEPGTYRIYTIAHW